MFEMRLLTYKIADVWLKRNSDLNCHKQRYKKANVRCGIMYKKLVPIFSI